MMEPSGQLEFCFPPAQANEKPAHESTKPKKSGRDRDLTMECVELVRSLCPGKLEDHLSVCWNQRMRSTAGRAFWPEGRIELNPRLLDFAPDEVRSTMLHELAHLLAYARAGRRRIKAHGAEWRQACRELGIPHESVTHSLPLPSREMAKKWRYTCPVCQESIERVRKMKRYAGCYRCCKEHNGGYYHRKFRLVESRME
jgi:predicted SprT family Zn-dependent metalloprotease